MNLSLSRRSLLAVLATAGSGCLSGEDEFTEPQSIKYIEPDKPLSAYPCPQFERLRKRQKKVDNGIQETVCHNSQNDSPMELSASRRRINADSARTNPETIRFQLWNHANLPFVTNFAAWWILALTGEGWQLIGPSTHTESSHQLDPGESHSWQVIIGSEKMTNVGREDVPAKIGSANRGIYAFAISGKLQKRPSHDETTVERPLTSHVLTFKVS